MKRILPQAMAQAQAMGVPEMVVQILVSSPEVAPDPQVDNNEACIQWLRKWANENEGQEAKRSGSPLYAGAKALIDLHKQGIVQMAQEQVEMQIAAQAPQMQLQQAMQQQQMGQQAEMQGQQQAQQHAQEQESKEADRAHEEGMSERQMQHASEMSAADREVAMAKVKAQKAKAK